MPRFSNIVSLVTETNLPIVVLIDLCGHCAAAAVVVMVVTFVGGVVVIVLFVFGLPSYVCGCFLFFLLVVY